ncbi:MAG: AMP-dependent synthetase and ligase, partial [Thermoleophilia bacterium]|nr:AMP-dependent synthetase and ligase [Thermoleophilia bacterium]
AEITDRDFQLGPDAVLYTHKVQSFITVLERGGRAVVAPLGWDVEEFLDDVVRHGVTDAILVASQAWEFANHLRDHELPVPPSLQAIYLQAAPITVPVCERLHEVLGDGVRVLCIYGMTEILPVASIDSRDKVRLTPAEGDLVGPITEGVEARVDEHGELHLRGANGYRGYLGHPDVDWHATGDLARIDEQNNIILMGRAKDMLLRGGFNLYPGLYEDTITRIDGVGACAIVGVPDPETADERVVLFVEPHDTDLGERELLEHVERALRSGSTAIDVRALPDDIIVVPALARSGRSSKIDRKELRVVESAHVHGS